MNGFEQEIVKEFGFTPINDQYSIYDFDIFDDVKLEVKERTYGFSRFTDQLIPIGKLNKLKDCELQGKYDTLYLVKSVEGYHYAWVSDLNPYAYPIRYKDIKTPCYLVPNTEFKKLSELGELARLI